MAVTATSFLTTFPEFDAAGFPKAQIGTWIQFATTFLSEAVWGGPSAAGQPPSPYDWGIMLYAAHNISLEMQAGKTAASGGPVGLSTGIVNRKQVDKVSVGYDVGATVEEGAGQWNLTVYGRRFARLAEQFGNAPMYVSPGRPDGVTGSNAYAGPGFPYPGYNFW